jgi:hypothetical protein
MVGRDPQLPPGTGAAMAVVTDGADRGAAEAASAPGLDLMWAKLGPPALRAGLIRRARLQSLLRTGVQARPCLLAAPAGSGKTTLLSQWRVAGGGDRVAWMSVGEGDNDPTRFWTAVVEALGTVEPSLGTAALVALGDPRLDLERVVLPSLLGELGAVDRPLMLVLDDYQLMTDASRVRTLGLLLEQLPAGVHLALATRVDPPLPLAGLRASGELAELRVAELQFTSQEASALLNGAMGLGLAAAGVERLVERTEGSAAGLVLAGLALRGRPDPSAFVASFHGDDRHVAGFLAAELLEGSPSSSGYLGHGHAELLGQRRQRLGILTLDQAHSRYLLHGGPLPSGVLADARHLPHGRSQAGDRHHNFNKPRDNLRAGHHRLCGSPPRHGSRGGPPPGEHAWPQ